MANLEIIDTIWKYSFSLVIKAEYKIGMQMSKIILRSRDSNKVLSRFLTLRLYPPFIWNIPETNLVSPCNALMLLQRFLVYVNLYSFYDNLFSFY